MNATATLFEFQAYPYEVAGTDSVDGNILRLTEETLAALDAMNATRPILEIGRETIRPLNLVGVMKVGGITLEILPKLFKGEAYQRHRTVIAGNLLTMLACTERLSIREVDLAGLDLEQTDLFEVFIFLFAKRLARLLKSTQRREYTRQDEELRFVRGRIDIRAYTNPARLHIIPCTFHEYSVDNPLNRTLKYTCHLMARTSRRTETVRILRSITDLLDAVTLTPVTVAEVDTITFTRLNRAFEPFIRVCRIFLANATLTLQASDVETFSLLIPMERLFEEFVAAVIAEDPAFFFGQEMEVAAQQRNGHLVKRMGGGHAFALIPDIVARGPAGETMVIDTKYKILKEAETAYGVSQADMYQIFAYVVKLPAQAGMLLYPDTELKAPLDYVYDVSGRKVPLLVRSVRLSHPLATREGREAFREELAGVVQALYNTRTDRTGERHSGLVLDHRSANNEIPDLADL
ncbi:hypothetical protein RJ40_00975 [Methanofollis aquaemaris]|uniref:5-methylcytosine-specific restriction enzyme subunit McrC n=1 Tax=Methanofollis aquaemaris TaxID=126734 RepID=A0A8A3S3D5_9EURY|nr:McrC family protein [Methanofollis aquaemaris]QSZ66170.1 hypothetical protein RJ40_00975 [Methanofollis aquaemaris]